MHRINRTESCCTKSYGGDDPLGIREWRVGDVVELLE